MTRQSADSASTDDVEPVSADIPETTRTAMTISRRLTPAIAAFAIIAAACGGAPDGASASAATDAPSTEAPVETAAPAGDPAPAQTFALFDGGTATLADFQGQPLVVNFWASWCPSCVAEMSAAFKPVQESLGEQVTFVGMNIQDERELADRLLAETGVDWISAEDPNGELYVELGGLGMPFTVYLDAAGNVIHEHNGPLDEALLRSQITENLGVAS